MDGEQVAITLGSFRRKRTLKALLSRIYANTFCPRVFSHIQLCTSMDGSPPGSSVHGIL